MRESSLISLYERRCVLLNQLSSALRGRTVALWRVARGGLTTTEAVSQQPPPENNLEFDVAGELRRWGRLALPHSMWVGCCVTPERWHVAPVRSDPPAPPPAGLERRSPERIVVELGGLCLGAHERTWAAVDQATVQLCSALAVLDTCLDVMTTDDLTSTGRAHILADLANLADILNGGMRPH